MHRAVRGASMNPSSSTEAMPVELSDAIARDGRHGPVIVDTNVLIGCLPTANGPGTLAPILDGMLDGSIAFIVSDALLSEYRAVLLRPALLARLRLAPSEVAALVDRLARRGTAMQPVPAPPAPDPGDQLLWELLAACPDARLLTRDTLLLRKGRMRRRVILPEAFDLASAHTDPRPRARESDLPPSPRS
jgi:predicted nucleic acid-binding protein